MSRRPRYWVCLIWLGLACCASPEHSRAEEPAAPINLLRAAGVSLAESTAKVDQRAALAAITDGQRDAAATVDAAADAPLEVVYGFGGKTVALEKLVVSLAPSPPGGARQVEILVSTTSANSGFRSLRSDPLEQNAEPQTFTFPATGAGWIMLRFTPAADGKQVAIAEVEVLGHEGPPATRYEFKEAPAKAFDVLARLKTSSLGVVLSADESSLFADAADGKLDTWTFTEAALLASGVADKSQRKKYVQQLQTLEQQAAATLAGAKSPFERGEKLLAFLHQTALAKGYESQQTDLSAILDTGKYNCVSSAVLYNIVGTKLGLDLRAIEVPDHAFSILYDGTRHADIETTTAEGFNPLRDEAARKEFEEKTGFRYIPDSHRDQRREVSVPGLVAIVYYNHGVELTRQKKHHEALLTYFRALSLDSEFDSAVKNALATLANWSSQLADEGKFEESLGVLGAGLDLAPADRTLAHNHKVIWGQWAQAEMAAGKADQALDILRRAAAKTPADAEHFAGLESWLFIKRGEELADAKQWRPAMDAVEPGFAKLTGKAAEELRDWRNGVYLRWSSAELEAGHFEQAADILQDAVKAVPDDTRLSNNLVYTVQEWIRSVLEKQGEEAAKQTAIMLVKRFESLPEVREVAKNHFRRVVLKYSEAGQPDEALAAIERHQDLLALVGDAEESQEMIRAAYDGAARKHMQPNEWEQALAIYERGLAKFKDDEHLTRNLTYVAQEWLRETYESKGEQPAGQLAATLLKRLGAIEGVQDVAGNHFRRVVLDLREQGKFEDALASIKRQQELLEMLKDKDAAKQMLEAVYDGWARTFFNKDWPKAISIYQQGLKEVPDSSLLQNNLKYSEQRVKK